MFNVSPFASLAEVNRMLAAWGVQATAYEPARGGVENQCLIVDTSAAPAQSGGLQLKEESNVADRACGAERRSHQPGRVVFRIHRPDAAARARLELAALERLAAEGLPVPRPLRTLDGALLGGHDGSPASLLSYVDGVTLDRRVPTPGFGHGVGVLLAHADLALARLPDGRDQIGHDITDLAAARDRLAACRRIAGFPWQRVEDAVEDAARAVAAWPALPRQVIHGDASRANIVCADDGRFSLIDFGDAGAAPRVADIAIAIAQLAIAGGRLRPEIWSGLWVGWAGAVNPSDAERAAVLPLVKLRYANLIVDHVWRELTGRHHAGHMALVALGIEGLHALASAPPALLSLPAALLRGAA
jgi:Ser/Thr protein kinase RdoA (MazF antagonist)